MQVCLYRVGPQRRLPWAAPRDHSAAGAGLWNDKNIRLVQPVYRENIVVFPEVGIRFRVLPLGRLPWAAPREQMGPINGFVINES